MHIKFSENLKHFILLIAVTIILWGYLQFQVNFIKKVKNFENEIRLDLHI